MSLNAKSRLTFFLLFLAGSAVGFIVGGYTGSNFGIALIINNTLTSDALNVQTQVKALRNLRAGNTRQTIESLESNLDDHLVIFDPHDPYPGLKDGTIVTIEKAIKSAHDYRLEFPRQSNRPQVDVMVKNLFNKHNLEN